MTNVEWTRTKKALHRRQVEVERRLAKMDGPAFVEQGDVKVATDRGRLVWVLGTITAARAACKGLRRRKGSDFSNSRLG